MFRLVHGRLILIIAVLFVPVTIRAETPDPDIICNDLFL